MATIHDVAARAGVAPITVSRVLNNSGYVSETTRLRVEAAATELDYVPNMLARSLRSNRTNTLALVLTDITNPFWTTVARGVEDVASEQGFNVILCNTDEQDAKQEQYLSVLMQRRVDGFLLVPTSSTSAPVKMIQKQKIPLVVLDRRVPDVAVDMVRGASQDGAYQLMRYLLEQGHRQIAILSGPKSVSTSLERIAGCRQAYAEASVAFDAQWIQHGKYTAKGGYAMTQRAIAWHPRPTAIFACNNFIAMGALKRIKESGLRVPEDISIVGFDDLPPSWDLDPFLTVAAQPAYAIGQQATELLLQRITGPDDADGLAECRDVVLPAEIHIRRSCRRISEQDDAIFK